MGICIHISKYKVINNIHIYHVKTPDCGGHEFYVTLFPTSEVISFYWDADLKKLIKSIDASNPKTLVSIPELDSRIFGPVIIRCLKAFKNNDFPENMGYYS